MHMCVYIYIYICTCTYNDIYIYIYIILAFEQGALRVVHLARQAQEVLDHHLSSACLLC